MDGQETAVVSEMTRVVLALTLARAEGADAAGGAYPVTAITEGEANGLYFAAEALRQSVPLWEGLSVFVDHLTPAEWTRPGGHSVRDLVGVLHEVTWSEERRGVRGVLRLLSRARWLADLFDECLAIQAAGLPTPKLGLSADLEVDRQGTQVTGIRRVYSLDVVMNPARGGAIEPTSAQLADVGEEQRLERSPIMDKQDSIRVQTAREEAGTAAPERSAWEQMQRDTCAALLAARLAESRLPEPLGAQLRERFVGRVFAGEELDAELARAKALHAQLRETQTVQHLGAVTKMWTTEDRLQLAFERLLGLSAPEDALDQPRLSGIRELYLKTTGDYDMTGRFQEERVTLANITSSTMTSIVKNALNKVLVQSFEMRPFWWKPIVWEEDFATLHDVTWITTGGFADLPTVAEGDDYLEAASPTDAEETSAFLKKGAYAAITLEAIDRDQVALVRAIPRKLGLAANRTLSAAISSVFTANSGVGPTLGQDSKALFHTDHGNLGSAALDLTSWDAAVQAMYKQTEAVSIEQMGLRPAHLVVPIELEYAAHSIMDSPGFVGGTAVTPAVNPRYGSAAVVVCPDFTDGNNWAAVADPREAPGVCVGYRYGRAPELFIANDPLSGAMFTADALRIKVRFFFTVGIGDYRALYKANVT